VGVKQPTSLCEENKTLIYGCPRVFDVKIKKKLHIKKFLGTILRCPGF
jgi:hypothetical protein